MEEGGETREVRMKDPSMSPIDSDASDSYNKVMLISSLMTLLFLSFFPVRYIKKVEQVFVVIFFLVLAGYKSFLRCKCHYPILTQ